MPSQKIPVGISTNQTTDLKMPVRNDGHIDRRYKTPQFINQDGSRDM